MDCGKSVRNLPIQAVVTFIPTIHSCRHQDEIMKRSLHCRGRMLALPIATGCGAGIRRRLPPLSGISGARPGRLLGAAVRPSQTIGCRRALRQLDCRYYPCLIPSIEERPADGLVKLVARLFPAECIAISRFRDKCLPQMPHRPAWSRVLVQDSPSGRYWSDAPGCWTRSCPIAGSGLLRQGS